MIGEGYAARRQPDPRIASRIESSLGAGSRVVNVGAGTGSYEPSSCRVVAVEPSTVMIAQRRSGAAPCVRARAEQLPFSDRAFDAALAVLTTHHWEDAEEGLREMARVSDLQLVLTWDKRAWQSSWLVRDYLPEICDLEADLAALDVVLRCWPSATVEPVPVPADCRDGFLAAYWQRPEAYLEVEVRRSISSFARLPEAVTAAALARLAADLESGRWHARNRDLLSRTELDCGYRLVVHRSA